MRLFLLLISALLLSYGTASSQENNPCPDAKTQLEMSSCYNEQYRVADSKLNDVYNKLMAQLNPEHKDKVKKAQITWIKLRDQHCDAEAYLSTGGSVHALELTICKAALTKTRTDQLHRISNDLK